MNKNAPEHTGASYEGKAKEYARNADQSPWNVHYERPAVVSLLPLLAGKKVLDVGCGSGWYAEYLLNQGAEVTAFDLNAEFVEMTAQRAKYKAEVHQGDLSKPLDFAQDGEFDLVLCPLVMHYLKDWQPAFREFHRILKPNGTLVFSTHHPFNDWKLFDTESYFDVELLEDEWEGVGKVSYYRRPLTVISQDLASTGFLIERLYEPQPTEDFRTVNPEKYDLLSKNPWFLVIRAVKREVID